MKYAWGGYEDWSLELTFESATLVRAEGTCTFYLDGNEPYVEDKTYNLTVSYQ